MNNTTTIICPEHGNEVIPFWSKKNKDWYAICNAGVINLKNGQVGNGHFVKINDDLEFDHGYQNQCDEHEHRDQTI